MLANSTSSSSSVPEEDEDIHIISSTRMVLYLLILLTFFPFLLLGFSFLVLSFSLILYDLSNKIELLLILAECSDGSFIFKFGNASEIRENLGELDQNKLVREVVEEVEEGGVRALLKEGVEKVRNEDDRKLGEEIESSSVVIVGVADPNSQLLVTEEESAVLDSDLDTIVINDSQKNDRHLKLDSVEDGDGLHGILGENVAAESVSEEDSQFDSHKEVVDSTVSPDSGVLSDLSNSASGYEEVEEKEEGDILAYVVFSRSALSIKVFDSYFSVCQVEG